MTTARILTTLAGVLLALPSAQAMDLRPGGVFAQAGSGDHSMHAAAVGLVWPWSWQHAMGPGQWTGYTEAYVSRWNARANGGRANFDHVGVAPMFRYRWSGGRSPWFVEGGVGVIYMDRLFASDAKRFSTRLNFADTLGVGRSFGEREQHEVTLRFSHFSNGGFKHPNPGQNLVRLRYAYLF